MNFDPDTNDSSDNSEDMDQQLTDQQLTMEELVAESLQHLREGEVVKGTVVAITNDEVMVDVGFKSEGTIPVHQFRDRESGELTIAIGDEIEVFIERIDELEGELRLSHERASKLKVWNAIEKAFRQEEAVSGHVVERVKGGLSVDIGVRAFLPGSLVDLRLNRPLEEYIGEEIEARIISFDRRRSNVVLSRKAVLEQEQTKAKVQTMEELEEGKVVTGVVKNITDYGVFIDLGGIDGLLHITDISWGRVGHPRDYFQVGDEVDVVVLRFDRERERVSLGYKQRFEDPWTLVPEKYPMGKRLSGKVVSIVDYGAFVELEEGVEGLVHVSEMSWTKKIKNPRSVLDVSQEVDVVVSEVDPEKRRLSLSLRATEPNPWETVAEKYQVSSRIHGVVRNLTDFGAFVEIVPGVDGLVHISDMSWTRRINHPSEVVQKGQEVEAIITSIDVLNQRISLSMKELLPNEWEEFANSHSVGDVALGKVTNVTDFGVFVELAPGVEGLCHISEIGRDTGLGLAESFEPGQAVRCRILRIDWNENRIGLSMHGLEQELSEEEAVQAASPAADRRTDTAMAAALKASGLLSSDEEEVAEPETEAAAAEEQPEAEPEVEAAAAEEQPEAEPETEAAAAEEQPEAEPEVEAAAAEEQSEAEPEVEAAAAEEQSEAEVAEEEPVDEQAQIEEEAPEPVAAKAAEADEPTEEEVAAEAVSEEAEADGGAEETEEPETAGEEEEPPAGKKSTSG